MEDGPGNIGSVSELGISCQYRRIVAAACRAVAYRTVSAYFGAPKAATSEMFDALVTDASSSIVPPAALPVAGSLHSSVPLSTAEPAPARTASTVAEDRAKASPPPSDPYEKTSIAPGLCRIEVFSPSPNFWAAEPKASVAMNTVRLSGPRITSR